MNQESEQFSLLGQFLLAMPEMKDPRFARTVIFICSHNDQGAMGFVLTQPVEAPAFADILRELKLTAEADAVERTGNQPPVYRGGPVEQGRGFVLHSLDYGIATTTRIGDFVGVTATQDVLRSIATEGGPSRFHMLLGYAGWGAGQLESEISRNDWLTMPATRSLLFDTPVDELYSSALHAMGVSEALLSGSAGHA